MSWCARAGIVRRSGSQSGGKIWAQRAWGGRGSGRRCRRLAATGCWVTDRTTAFSGPIGPTAFGGSQQRSRAVGRPMVTSEATIAIEIEADRHDALVSGRREALIPAGSRLEVTRVSRPSSTAGRCAIHRLAQVRCRRLARKRREGVDDTDRVARRQHLPPLAAIAASVTGETGTGKTMVVTIFRDARADATASVSDLPLSKGVLLQPIDDARPSRAAKRVRRRKRRRRLALPRSSRWTVALPRRPVYPPIVDGFTNELPLQAERPARYWDEQRGALDRCGRWRRASVTASCGMPVTARRDLVDRNATGAQGTSAEPPSAGRAQRDRYRPAVDPHRQLSERLDTRRPRPHACGTRSAVRPGAVDSLRRARAAQSGR